MNILEICNIPDDLRDSFEAYPIDITKDNRAFISIGAIRSASGVWAEKANGILNDFSQYFCNAIDADDVKACKALAKIGREQNAYHLGMSKVGSRGNGSSMEIAIDSWVKDGLPFKDNMQQFIDVLPIITHGIDLDRSSDILGAILIQLCLAFTMGILEKYQVNVELRQLPIQSYYWDIYQSCPNNKMILQVPRYQGYDFILVPKEFVAWKPKASAHGFYRTVILDEQKLRPDWPLQMPDGENGLKEPRPMTKKQFLQENPGIDAKAVINEEIARDPERTPQLLFKYINRKNGKE